MEACIESDASQWLLKEDDLLCPVCLVWCPKEDHAAAPAAEVAQRLLQRIKMEDRDSTRPIIEGSTIDPEEVAHFNKHSVNWWLPNSSFIALLHYNRLRIPFIRNAVTRYTTLPLSQCKVLDVGCGAGFLAEGLAKEGSNVVGIDAAAHVLQVAEDHRKLSLQEAKLNTNPRKTTKSGGTLDRLQYVNAEVTEFAEQQPESFDAVVTSEVIEHVDNPPVFFKGCVSCLKPGGVMVVTTPNRTWISYLVMIFLSERVFGLIPKVGQ